MRTLGGIEEVFGPKHEVFVGVELTKYHERHYRDQVVRVKEQIESEAEGSRFKGEITLVIAPRDETESKQQE